MLFINVSISLIEESKNLSSSLFTPSLLVCHNTICGGQNNLSELTRGEEVHDPLLNFVNLHVKSGGDDTAFVEAAIELDDNLLGTVIIDNLEFPNVSCNLNGG